MTCDYLTTAQAAEKLGLSIGTVQKLVENGHLEAVRTHGGHRRIFASSFNEYSEKFGYGSRVNNGLICVLYCGTDVDSSFMQNLNPEKVMLISHPLELFNLKNNINSLFIDVRTLSLESTSNLLNFLGEKFNVFLYNCEKFIGNKDLLKIENVSLISGSINSYYISGYLAGRERCAEPLNFAYSASKRIPRQLILSDADHSSFESTGLVENI
jgi:excisionase family DNA binding protein